MSIRSNIDLRYKTSRNRGSRPKTFRSEESAHKYAKDNEMKDYKLVNLKSSLAKIKKIRIEQ